MNCQADSETRLFGPIRNRAQFAAWVLLFAALIAYKCYYCLTWVAPPVSDEITYLTIANNLISGNGFSRDAAGEPTAFVMPGYPMLVALLLKISGGSHILIYIVQVWMSAIVGLAFGGLLFLWTRNRRLAGLLALLVFVHPAFFYFPTKVLTEIAFSAWFALSLLGWESVRQKNDSFWAWLFFGVFHSLSFMTRPVTALLTPFILIWALWAGAPVNRRSISGMCFSAGIILLFWGPWVVRNWTSMGSFIPLSTSSGFILMAGSLPDVNRWGEYSEIAMKEAGIEKFSDDEGRANRAIAADAKQRIRENYPTYLWRAAKTSWRFWLSEYKILTGPKKRFGECFAQGDWLTLGAKLTLLGDTLMIFLLFLLSIPFAFIRPKYAPYTLLLVYFTVTHSLLIPLERYSVPLTGLVLAMGVAGIHEFIKARNAKVNRPAE